MSRQLLCVEVHFYFGVGVFSLIAGRRVFIHFLGRVAPVTFELYPSRPRAHNGVRAVFYVNIGRRACGVDFMSVCSLVHG